ncbi:MAG TPA: hypothetical protein VIT44_10595 [Cyclobacteriaceae bacterium]
MSLAATSTNPSRAKWYHYLFAFLAGLFLINIVPHFVNGVSGRPFPTPFSDPPGIGMSSPMLNVVWALINFVLGTLFLYLAKTSNHKWAWIAVFVGGTLMAFNLASHFGTVFNQ